LKYRDVHLPFGREYIVKSATNDEHIVRIGKQTQTRKFLSRGVLFRFRGHLNGLWVLCSEVSGPDCMGLVVDIDAETETKIAGEILGASVWATTVAST